MPYFSETSSVLKYSWLRACTFKFKAGYYREVLTPEARKLLGSTKSRITKTKNSANVPQLEIAELILVHSNIANTDYERDLRVFNTFVSNKSFGQLLDISPKNSIFLTTFDSEFSYIEVWFTDY